MRSTKDVRRRLVAFVATAVSAVVLATLPAAPAQATLGPPQPVDIQLRSYSGGYQTLVGRVVGTLQFDDGASAYHLSVVVCRQSSYTVPNVRITVNGVLDRSFAPQDGQPRPEICGGHGLSGVFASTVAYPGRIERIAVGIEGIHFDGSTARPVGGGASYLNPYY
jgi:hypothetical protein